MTGWNRQDVKGENAQGVDWSATKTATKYLPKGATWYDFWTGKQYKGGQNVTLETTIDRVPMFVRAGSILPLGPEMQYVGEKKWDNLEMRVYPGANGSFVLYEDEGDNYNYEKGAYATITFEWNDSKKMLTIGDRQGNYPGMLKTRTFTFVMPDGQQKQIEYSGSKTEIRL